MTPKPPRPRTIRTQRQTRDALEYRYKQAEYPQPEQQEYRP